MFLMTTRSSRFFVVLVHLVGVSTHLPSSFHYWSGTGISGVNPLSIVLENSDPETIEMKPHWLQDTFDQTCLGPMGGFSECGDATLWLVIPKQKRHARRRQWIRWATEDPEGDNEAQQKPQGYALQVVDDVNNYLQNRDSAEREGAGNTTPTDYSQKECLTRRSKDNKLVLAPCSQERSWAWQFNEHGILHFEKKSSKQSNRNHKRALLKKQRTLEQCLWRNASEAVLMSCDGEASQVNLTSDVEERVVQIALVRQATATLSESEPDDSPSTGKASSKGRSDPSSNKRPKDAFSNLPHQGGIAHSHASDPVVHSEPKQASRLTSLSRQKASQSGTGTAKLPVRFLKDTNPILLAGGRQLERNAFSDATPRMDSSSPKSILHETTPSSMKPKIRKIQVNPYIAASNDERWKDPLTGLVYRTDLCQYLGHERAEVGRHTLVGVGQFMKTVFNIKVYGVALYASKRDVLADPAMERFASLSSEELRANSDFYSVLRNMASYPNPTESGPAGSFDKTIFLKTNMQLALETMQSSLNADWKMLTQEAKDLLIGSSMKPRPASPAMLVAVADEENPSNCSCGQIPPEGVEADPNCCARGTELVFTWRKSGDLEVRLNGDFMDSFPRPDIAAGIFFEYLRLDDPMSVDYLDHVPDGFPFLLAPLSQVKGVTSPIVSQTSPSTSSKTSANPVLKALEGFGEVVSSTSNNIAGFVQNSASEFTNTAVNTARSVGDAARSLGEDMERRRDGLGKHVSAFARHTMSAFYGRDQKSLKVVLPNFWLGDMSNLNLDDMADPKKHTNAPRGRIFKSTILSKLFGSEESQIAADEIVPMIYPPTNATHRLFIGIVHLYLLLILIVSFPAHFTTRTKLVVIRKKLQAISDSENSDSDGENSTGSLDFFPRKSAPMSNRKKNGTSSLRPFPFSWAPQR